MTPFRPSRVACLALAGALLAADHAFVMADEPDVRLVFRVAGDSATAIEWTSRGRTLSLPRAP